MDWPTLLTQERYTANAPRDDPPKDRPMTPFQLDAEKIIYTSVFRRLQGKTQVYPLPIYDYLRTRLTHTYEVAFVGKIIARNIGIKLKSKLGNFEPEDLSDVVYAACLAHDLGNPPFGHIGEDAIQTWFSRRTGDEIFGHELKDPESQNDFLHFDGNAQGFRIMTRLSSWRDEGGMRLTYAVLGAFSKYPFSSKQSTPDKKKFGFMRDDRDAAETIFGAIGMVHGETTYRNPLAFVVEAADDISYLTTDIDDAHRMRQLPFNDCEALLREIVDSGTYSSEYKIYITINDQDRISFLRSLASATLIDGVVQTFLDSQEAIMNGKFHGSLVEKSKKFAEAAKTITGICKEKVYIERNKIQLEATGFNVILGLMNLFGEMIEQYIRTKGNLDSKDKNLYQLLPEESRSRMDHSNHYKCMIVLVDYIAGMTDRFALDLYQRLYGHSPAIGRMG